MGHLSRRVVLACVIAFVGCVAIGIAAGGPMHGFLDRRAVEDLLRVSLPRSVEDLNYYKFYPSPDYQEHYIYIKFRVSKEDYLDLMSRMGIPIYEKSHPELRTLLPGQWKAPPNLGLKWWYPKVDLADDMTIPDDTAMLLSLPDYTVAKYENNYVYIVIHRKLD